MDQVVGSLTHTSVRYRKIYLLYGVDEEFFGHVANMERSLEGLRWPY